MIKMEIVIVSQFDNDETEQNVRDYIEQSIDNIINRLDEEVKIGIKTDILR